MAYYIIWYEWHEFGKLNKNSVPFQSENVRITKKLKEKILLMINRNFVNHGKLSVDNICIKKIKKINN